MESIFSGVYAPIPDVGAYLSRIGISDMPACDLPSLSRLMQAHMMSVPFDNIDVFINKREPSLCTDALFDKIVKNRRGGYCFELNGLFSRLLASLGFEVELYAARVVKGDFLSPPSHEVLCVNVSGVRYFCDVGFGGPVPEEPIAIEYDKDIPCRGRTYRFEKRNVGTALRLLRNGEFSDLLIFSETSLDPVDFLPLNAFCAHSPIEPFIHKLIVWKREGAGRISIDGDIFRDGTEEIKIESRKHLSEILRTRFGMLNI